MPDIILHHFDISPFAEKVKLGLGLKGLSWRSVEIPLVMPKPDLTALTGGYRKTPVMQIGADIYCDTRRIAEELEARFPVPGFFPAGSRGQAFAITAWNDATLFRSGAALSMGTNADLPDDILSDRMSFFDFLADSDLDEGLPVAFATFRAGLEQMNDMLADGRDWILGAEPGWVDVASYSPVWMCRGNISGADALLAPLRHLVAWEQRVAALGHGERSEMSADEALAIAAAHASVAEAEYAEGVWPSCAIGDKVAVTPDDYGMDAVVGELLRLTHNDIALVREDERGGRVTVHFPRAGYRVEVVS